MARVASKGRTSRQIHVGTSGWHYNHWRGVFYPRGLRPESWLGYYSQVFRCVEVNNSFYRLPTKKAVAAWGAESPPEFVFAVKASRLITHMKKLRNCEEALQTFLDTMTCLGEKLGPILFQLPPRWHINADRLAEFLEILPRQHSYAFEFRDPSWFATEIYDLLSAHDCAFCQFELGELRSPEQITADLVYVRLHGPEGAYAGRYTPQALESLARRVVAWQSQGREVHVYFDNDERGYAVNNARLLNSLCLELGRSDPACSATE